MITFEQYIDKVLTADEMDSEPVCPFPANNGECYADRRAPKVGCISCEWAKKSYDSLAPDEIRKLYSEEINEMANHMIHERKVMRKGAKVFCVRCGSLGTRTPLRKWNDLYLCNNCYKIMKAEEDNNGNKV